MNNFNYLKDYAFLREFDNRRLKTAYTRIIILNKEELPLETIEGKVISGSFSINGSSSVRRTGSISFLSTDGKTDLNNLDNLLAMNKKIKIMIGFDNDIDVRYDKIIWFPMGIFVITQPSITHGLDGVKINLNFKDKMCLLNGECGGTLPTSITFDKTFSVYEIIQTLVCNFGGEPINKIFVNDIELEIKQIVTWGSSNPLYYNPENHIYSMNEKNKNLYDKNGEFKAKTYNKYEEIGYKYELFSFPGEEGLVTGIGDNICSVLDKIKSIFTNYEYFYDIEGNFIFQEMPNYLNNQYDQTDKYRLDNLRRVKLASNSLAILKDTNYRVDFNNNSSSIYTFEEGSGLITSYSNTPNYINIKNDFHIWGKGTDEYPIHYHMVIKDKPEIMNTYQVYYTEDEFGNQKINVYSGGKLPNGISDDDIIDYTPADWRAELYLSGLDKWNNGIRPDQYEQEIIDNFDSIYDFENKVFKVDIIKYPNGLRYFIDYLEPAEELHNYSVDNLGIKKEVYQQDTLVRMYDVDIPNLILINNALSADEKKIITDRCKEEGQPYSNVNSTIYDNLIIGAAGDSLANGARSLLYQHTSFNESITIQAMPIYYLEPNSRITVNDKASNIYGDYIIDSISLSLDGMGTMTITAKRALERI